MPKTKVSGINIRYKVDGEGEPLILIMGFGGGRHAWFFQTRAFKKYYKVITFDNRGVGKTDKPSSPYTMRAMADDTIGLMDYLGIDRAHILGFSLGGMIAQEVALNYPERVRKLILASTLAGREGEMREITSEILKAFGLREDFLEEDIRSVDITKFMRTLLAVAFNMRLYRIVFLVPIAKFYARLVDFKGLIGQLAAGASCNTLDRLHTIEAPTLVITGTGDRAAPPRSSDVIASRIPNAKLVKVEGGSHGFIMEMPGRFNKEVLDFLKGN